MDACILVPEQFSLVLTLHPNPKNILEMCVAVWSNCFMTSGTSLEADEGDIRYERLEVFSALEEGNVRYSFGCYDEISHVEDREVRHCNWVRFVKSSNNPDDVNMVALVVDNKPVFRLVKDVQPNDEIIVFFENIVRPQTPIRNTKEMEKDLLDELEDTILPDCRSPTSLLIHSPPPRVDECLSTGNGALSSSDDSLSAPTPQPNIASPTASNQNPPKRARERTWLPCEFCEKKFDRPSLLKRHMRTHTGEKPHVCEVCKKAFSTSSSLNTHRRIHSGEKPHQCKICGKKFTASSNLYYHRMTHNKDKPHKCTMCSKSFPTPGDLRSHMYVHNGSWPFKCDICDRGFSKQTNLKNHMLLHSGDKPHICNICDKRFALLCNLKTHMKTHDETRNTPPKSDIMEMNEVPTKNKNKISLLKEENLSKNEHSSGLLKRSELLDSFSERQCRDAPLSYPDNKPAFISSSYAQYPMYCSTPKQKDSLAYSVSCFPAMPQIPSPTVSHHQYNMNNMMFQRLPHQPLSSYYPGVMLEMQ